MTDGKDRLIDALRFQLAQVSAERDAAARDRDALAGALQARAKSLARARKRLGARRKGGPPARPPKGGPPKGADLPWAALDAAGGEVDLGGPPQRGDQEEW